MMSELWYEIMMWVARHKPGQLADLDGLWTGESSEWKVSVNGHDREIDGLPPLNIRLAHKVFFQCGVVNPAGGIISAGQDGEDDVISHFALAEPQP